MLHIQFNLILYYIIHYIYYISNHGSNNTRLYYAYYTTLHYCAVIIVISLLLSSLLLLRLSSIHFCLALFATYYIISNCILIYSCAEHIKHPYLHLRPFLLKKSFKLYDYIFFQHFLNSLSAQLSLSTGESHFRLFFRSSIKTLQLELCATASIKFYASPSLILVAV